MAAYSMCFAVWRTMTSARKLLPNTMDRSSVNMATNCRFAMQIQMSRRSSRTSLQNDANSRLTSTTLSFSALRRPTSIHLQRPMAYLLTWPLMSRVHMESGCLNPRSRLGMSLPGVTGSPWTNSSFAVSRVRVLLSLMACFRASLFQVM